MSLLTESGRKTARAQQRNYLATTLKRHEWFAQVPQQVVGGFAELLLVSRELRARIKIEGVQRADGSSLRSSHCARPVKDFNRRAVITMDTAAVGGYEVAIHALGDHAKYPI
jgi:hypothetical protein